MNLNTNPLTEHLPRILDNQSFNDSFSHSPDLLKTNTKEERLLEAEKIISELTIGLPQHYYFYIRVLTKMYESYRLKINEDVIRKLKEIDEPDDEKIINLLYQELNTTPSVLGTYLKGIAGTGKTTIVNYIVRSFPRVIIQTFHPQLIFKQIPILKIDTPHRSSRKDLCSAILKEMDTILGSGSNYYDDYRNLTENKLTNIVKSKVLIHFVGTIIIDEIQDLRTNSGPSELTLAFIKNISNTLKVPIVYVGSLEAEEILFGNFQLCTRSQGFTWLNLKEDKPEWNYYINKLFSCTILDKQELTDELKSLYFRITGGIPRLLSILHAETQQMCLHSNTEIISIKEILIVANNILTSTNDLAEGIAKNIKEILKTYHDLHYLIGTSPKTPVATKPKVSAESSTTSDSPAMKDSKIDKSLIDPNIDRTLLELFENCKSPRDLYNIYKENGITRPLEELLTI